MQINITMRYYHTPTRMAKIKQIITPNIGHDVEKLDHSHITGRDVKWYSHLGKECFFSN